MRTRATKKLLDANASFCGLVLHYWLGGDPSAYDHEFMHNSLHHGNVSTRQPLWPHFIPLLFMTGETCRNTPRTVSTQTWHRLAVVPAVQSVNSRRKLDSRVTEQQQKLSKFSCMTPAGPVLGRCRPGKCTQDMCSPLIGERDAQAATV